MEQEKQAMTEHEIHVVNTKQLRKNIDAVIQQLKSITQGQDPHVDAPIVATRNSRERSLALTKLQEAVMWLGMDLKALGENNPYPNSYNPQNTIVDKTADGLKL